MESVVDHDKAYSIYFSDPYGHRLEVTTYDYDALRAELTEMRSGIRQQSAAPEERCLVLELAHMTVRLQGNGREVMPSLNGQAEAALFVEDASRARDFYQHVLGLQKLQESEVGCVFAVAKEQALLLVASSPSASTHLTQPQLTFRPHERSA